MDRVALTAHTNTMSTMTTRHIVNSVEALLTALVVAIVQPRTTDMAVERTNAGGAARQVPGRVARMVPTGRTKNSLSAKEDK